MTYVTDTKLVGSPVWASLRDAGRRALKAVWIAIKTSQERRAAQILAEYERSFHI